MTAEQALIEENKKDQRVRYITSHNTCTDFWIEKPFYNGVQWIGVAGSLIKSTDFFVDFGDRESFFICIDYIKPEVPPIPEKWYIEFTEDNFMILDSWRQKKAHSFLRNCFLLSDDFFKDGSFYVAVGQSIPENYQKITLEQFKKYVLGEEKQNENSSSHSTDSYVKSGSIGGVDISGKYVKTGRIGSVDLKVNPFTSQSNDNAFEFYDKKYWIEDRINYINQFIKRNIDSDLCINPDWVTERNELIEKLKNL